MIDRQALTKQYGQYIDTDGVFIKTMDQLYHADLYFEFQVTEFLTPDLSTIFEQIVRFQTDLKVVKWGVFSHPERVKLLFVPEFVEVPKMESYLTLLDIKYNQKFNQLEHKDALGALMALGIKRSKLGDIVVYDGGFQVVVEKGLSDYFLSSVDKIGRAGVSIQAISTTEAKEKVEKTKEVSGTVKSIRLDSIVALSFSISRSESQKLIETDMVKVNHIVTSRADFVPKVQDLISVRGYGRFTIQEILGVTKKDRIRIVLSLMAR